MPIAPPKQRAALILSKDVKVLVHSLGWGLALALACGGLTEFECSDDAQCKVGSRQGICQPSGYCSFSDDDCESGQRYGDHAPAELADQCVPSGGTTEAVDATTVDHSTSDAPTSTTGITSTNGTTDPNTSSVDASTGGETASATGSTSLDTDESDDDDAATTETPTVHEVSFGERDDADVTDVTYDTFVEAEQAELNFGSHTDLHVWEWGGSATTLLRFDLTAIPVTATILDARLELWTEGSGVLERGTVSGHRMLEAWEDGSFDGEAGVANWDFRLADVPWTTPGARAGSHDAAVLFQLDPTQSDTAYEVLIPATVVQSWIESAEDNHGLAIYGDADAATGSTGWVVSSEYWAPERRPLLVIRYED